jgi:hypothetical protein
MVLGQRDIDGVIAECICPRHIMAFDPELQVEEL